MSIYASAWAWEQDIPNSAHKLVLLKLADQANDDGYCWPSVRTLSAHTQVPERSVRYALTALEDAGFLEVSARYAANGRQTSNGYTLLVRGADFAGEGANLAGGEGANLAGTGVRVPQGEGAAGDTPTTLNHQREPSEGIGTPPPPNHSHPDSVQVGTRNVRSDPKGPPSSPEGRRKEWREYRGLGAGERLSAADEAKVRAKERPPGHADVAVRAGGPVWDALAEATGYTDLDPGTVALMAGPVADLEARGATPEQIRLAAETASREWEPRMINPASIARHFRGLLRVAATPANPLGRRSSKVVQDIEALQRWGREHDERTGLRDDADVLEGGVPELGPPADHG